MKAPTLERADCDGWYVRLGGFTTHPGGVYLFLEKSLELGYRTLWYGVWTRKQADIDDVISRARRIWPDIQEWEKSGAVQRARLRKPFREHPEKGEYYFGKYEWLMPPFGTREEPQWIRRTVDFLIAVEQLWSSERRTTVAKRVPQTVRARRGQKAFRDDLLAAYAGRCCVTRSTVEPVLEAAHIVKKTGYDIHSVANGLLLRSDIHTLLDLSLLAINPQTLKVAVHPDLREGEYHNLAGAVIRLPAETAAGLNRAGLQQRWKLFVKACKSDMP